jgi:LDH2 family malate/lactate/ureidoglycolate dehydrogenase
MSDQDAAIGADAMIWSDLRGRPRHGVTGRLPQVTSRLRLGANATPAWSIQHESGGLAVLDADGGWGQIAGTRAMELAVGKARETGIGATVVRNADVAAALGRYPALAIDQQMIGLAINNSDPTMSVWGSRAGLLGNQAFAIGSPAGRHFPLLFDSALSAMSTHGITAARDRGDSLPAGIALDMDGAPTLDPAKALDGVLLPAGGHRGSGLALMWEVLTGVLAGARMAPDLGGVPLGIGMFCMAVDPSIAMPYDNFVARIDRLIDAVHASPPARGVDQVRVPGQYGYQFAATNRRDGIPVTAEQDATLRGLGQEYGVPWPP